MHRPGSVVLHGPAVWTDALCLFQLYEQILAENEKLKAQLRDTDLELTDLKLQLEKATQVGLACGDGC